MGAYVFSCPITGDKIDPGIEAGMDGIRFAALHVRCPHCSEHHEIRIEETALDEQAA